jgi:hypothetical protein
MSTEKWASNPTRPVSHKSVCDDCGAVRTTKVTIPGYGRRLRCVPCGRTTTHHGTETPPRFGDYRESENAKQCTINAAIREEINHLEGVLDLIATKTQSAAAWRLDARSDVAMVTYRGGWVVWINSDCTLRGHQRALRVVLEQVISPRNWLGKDHEDVRTGKRSWTWKASPGDLIEPWQTGGAK